MSSADTSKYWFRAKRYGWGWGLPCAWQGWAVLIAYLVLIISGIPFIKALTGTVAYFAYSSILTIAFIGICWLTGEPPSWRWGDDDSR